MNRKSKKVFLILVIDAILVLLSIYAFIVIIEKSDLPFKYSGDLLIDSTYTAFSVLKSSKSDSLRIIKFNGISVNTRDDIEFLCDDMSIASKVNLEIKSGTRTFDYKCELKHYYDLLYMIVLVIVFLLFFIPGIYVVIKKSDDKASVVFHWLVISAGFFVVDTWGRFHPTLVYLDITIRILYDLSQILLGALFIHFSLIFPSIKWKGYKNPVRVIYIISFAISIYLFYPNSIAIITHNIDSFHKYIFLHHNLLEYGFDLLVLIGLVNFIHSYWISKDELERKKLRWVLYGVAFGPTAYIFLWQIPLEILNESLISEWLMILLTGIAPITFFISIVRFRVFDIDFIINRSLVYVTALLTIAITFFSIEYFLGNILNTLSFGKTKIASFIGAVVAAIIFERFKNTFQIFIDKRFFKVKYNSQTSQKQFLENVKYSISNEDVAKLFVDSISDIMAVEKIAFILFNFNKKILNVINQENFINEQIDFESIEKLNFSNSKLQIFAVKGWIEDGVEYSVLDEESNNNLLADLIIASPIEEYGLYLIVLVGHKKSRFMFTLEDIEILKNRITNCSITIHRIELQNELLFQQEESKRLEELNQIKSRFVSSVSHELKTPLTSIRMFAEIMKMKELGRAKTNEYLGIIQSECDRLNRLINNVLDYSKMEKGMKQYHFNKGNLNDLVNEVYNIFKAQESYQKFNIEISLDENLTEIMIDSDAIVEALINLVSNSIKYSSETKNIYLSTYQDEKQVHISVRDEGFGISDEDLEHIFNAFYRSKNENQLHSGGTGLGLTIVKNIMTAHRGFIDVKSILGAGSTFTLCFFKEILYEKDINN